MEKYEESSESIERERETVKYHFRSRKRNNLYHSTGGKSEARYGMAHSILCNKYMAELRLGDSF